MDSVINYTASRFDKFIEKCGVDPDTVNAIPTGQKSKHNYVSSYDIYNIYGDEPISVELEGETSSRVWEVNMDGLASKTSDKKIRHKAYFIDEHLAAREVDIILIKNGRAPVNVLKKVEK